MSSRSSQAQTKQQQHAGTQGAKTAPLMMQSASRSTASTPKPSAGSNAAMQQKDVSQAGRDRRSEPPRSRPSSLAASSISPSDSISVRDIATASRGQARPGDWYNTQNLQNGPIRSPGAAAGAAKRVITPAVTTPSGTVNQRSTSSARSSSQGSVGIQSIATVLTPSATTSQYPPSTPGPVPPINVDPLAPPSRLTPSIGTTAYTQVSAQQSPQGVFSGSTLPSTTNVTNQQLSGVSRRSVNKKPSEATRGTWSAPLEQTHVGLSDQAAGPQLPVSVGISPASQVHLHFNQVDNRQMTINNNAPQNVTTTNNQVYNVDKSNHHNTNAPQANTYNSHVNNTGNTHTNTTQQATAVRQSASSNISGGQRHIRQPSESMPLRDRLYSCTKKVSVNEWSDKVLVKHTHVPNDRPC